MTTRAHRKAGDWMILMKDLSVSTELLALKASADLAMDSATRVGG